MKTILHICIAALLILIGCDIEANATANTLDYTKTLFAIPFILIGYAAIKYLDNEIRN